MNIKAKDESQKKPEPTELSEIVKDLTNGVGEKPYCRRVDGQMIVFVADDQEYCRVALIDEYDEKIAHSICEAGLFLQAQKQQIDHLTAENKGLKKTARCPCGAELEGVGYDVDDVIYRCKNKKCRSQLYLSNVRKKPKPYCSICGNMLKDGPKKKPWLKERSRYVDDKVCAKGSGD